MERGRRGRKQRQWNIRRGRLLSTSEKTEKRKNGGNNETWVDNKKKVESTINWSRGRSFCSGFPIFISGVHNEALLHILLQQQRTNTFPPFFKWEKDCVNVRGSVKIFQPYTTLVVFSLLQFCTVLLHKTNPNLRYVSIFFLLTGID